MKRFDDWLKLKMTKSPSIKLDQLILQSGKSKLKVQEDKRPYFGWALTGLVSASLIIFWVSIDQKGQYAKNPEISEPLEMITYYDEIETLEEVSNWTDAEWEYAPSKDRS